MDEISDNRCDIIISKKLNLIKKVDHNGTDTVLILKTEIGDIVIDNNASCN